MADPVPTQDPNSIAAPDMSGGLPAGISATAPPISQQAPPQGPPKLNMTPNVLQLLGGVLRPPTGTVRPGDTQPQRPVTRLGHFEDFLGNFLTAFSSGLAASGAGPGANARGAGAALMAPYNRDVRQWELTQQAGNVQSEEQLRAAQAQETQARGGYYNAQAEATRAASQLTPVQIPDGHGGTHTIFLPAKNAASIYQRIVSGDTARDVAGTRADATKQAAATRGDATVAAAELGKEGRQGAAQIAANAKITVEQMRVPAQQVRIFNSAPRPAQIIYQKTMDGINQWARDQERTGYLGYGADIVQAQKAFEADKQNRIDKANKDLLDRTQGAVGSNLPAGPGGTTPGATSSGFPKPSAKNNAPPNQFNPVFGTLIQQDAQLKTAAAALASIKDPNKLRSAIDGSKTLNGSQKTILKGYYGLK